MQHIAVRWFVRRMCSSLQGGGPKPEVFSVAPMLDWTNRHYRFLARLLTKRAALYTEMVVDMTIIHSPQWESHLRFDPAEGPNLVCQLGGSDPRSLAEAARRVETMGYSAINLNCGCPSDRVAGKGCFGAAMMLKPELVRECVAAMRSAVHIPVTVKCRIGADDVDSYAELARFIAVVAEGGCDTFIVHARKCLLRGLSPKENRNIPPLRYHWVQRLALDFPALKFGLNGGVGTLELAEELLALRRLGAPLLAPLPPGLLPADDAFIAEEAAASRADERAWKRTCRPLQQQPRAKEAAGAPAAAEASAPEGAVEASDDAVAAPAPAPAAVPGAAAAAPSYRVYDRCSPGPAAPGGYGGGGCVLDSVMVGRAAYNHSWILSDVDRRLFGVPNPGLSRRRVVERYVEYCEALAAGEGVPPDERGLALYRPFELLKPLIGLFHGDPGGGRFRATLAHDCQARKLPLRECVANALACLPDTVLDALPPSAGGD